MEGKDEDETEILLNPAHALVGAYGENKAMADTFAEWMARPDGGQKVVGEFAVNGIVLYTKVLEDCGSWCRYRWQVAHCNASVMVFDHVIFALWRLTGWLGRITRLWKLTESSTVPGNEIRQPRPRKPLPAHVRPDPINT